MSRLAENQSHQPVRMEFSRPVCVLFPVLFSAGACSGSATLTASNGTLTSGPTSYPDNAICSWLIQPLGGGTVTLRFTIFDLESNYDFVKVYDGGSASTQLLASLDGSSLPSPVAAASGTMFVEFSADCRGSSAGFDAAYTTEPPLTTFPTFLPTSASAYSSLTPTLTPTVVPTAGVSPLPLPFPCPEAPSEISAAAAAVHDRGDAFPMFGLAACRCHI